MATFERLQCLMMDWTEKNTISMFTIEVSLGLMIFILKLFMSTDGTKMIKKYFLLLTHYFYNALINRFIYFVIFMMIFALNRWSHLHPFHPTIHCHSIKAIKSLMDVDPSIYPLIDPLIDPT